MYFRELILTYDDDTGRFGSCKMYTFSDRIDLNFDSTLIHRSCGWRIHTSRNPRPTGTAEVEETLHRYLHVLSLNFTASSKGVTYVVKTYDAPPPKVAPLIVAHLEI